MFHAEPADIYAVIVDAMKTIWAGFDHLQYDSGRFRATLKRHHCLSPFSENLVFNAFAKSQVEEVARSLSSTRRITRSSI